MFKLAHYRPRSHENHELDLLISRWAPGRNFSTLPMDKEVRMWIKPEYTEMRFGFEVTMYIANR